MRVCVFKLKLEQQIELRAPVFGVKMLVLCGKSTKRANAELCTEPEAQSVHLMNGRITGDLTGS
jgi:hypothetical protein